MENSKLVYLQSLERYNKTSPPGTAARVQEESRYAFNLYFAMLEPSFKNELANLLVFEEANPESLSKIVLDFLVEKAYISA